VTVIGGPVFARLHSMAPPTLYAEVATGRTVRHPVRKSLAVVSEDAQIRTVRPDPVLGWRRTVPRHRTNEGIPSHVS
jgi:hypothetical protein